MKTNRIFWLLALMMYLSFVASSCEDKKKREQQLFTPTEEVVHIITLLVDTDSINGDNVLKKCRFVGQKPNQSADKFAYPYLKSQKINVGETVIWQAQDYHGNELDVMNIIFEEKTPFGQEKPGKDNKRVEGRPDKNTPKGGSKYKIQFKVDPSSTTFYEIDPVLKVGEPGSGS